MSSDEESSAGSEVEEQEVKKKAPAKKKATKEPKTKKAPKKSAKKKKKDPDAPKRPLSAFMFYSMKNRPLVKKEHPEAAFADVAKILGEQWKALDENQRKEFDKQHATDKARFEKEKAAYDKKKSKEESEEEEDEESDD